ncbi:MAG: hypothetical protein M3246_03375 [Actinomycetota bacterium]|nr:hypothetical protein [Actinomycetota bacterium]
MAKLLQVVVCRVLQSIGFDTASETDQGSDD